MFQRFRRLLPLFAVCIAVGLSGCAMLEDFLKNAEKPTASIAGVSISSLDLSKATLQFDVDVANPYSFALPVGKIDYKLTSSGNQFLAGAMDQSTTIASKGTSRIRIPAEVKFLDVIHVLSGVRPGAVIPYNAEFGIAADAGAFGQLRLPLTTSGEVPVPAVPDISLKGVAWDSVSLNSVSGHITLGVKNTNSFPVDLSHFGWALSLNGTEVSHNSISNPVSFAAGQEQELTLSPQFSPMSLGGAALRMISDGKANYKLNGAMKMRTSFAPIDMPYEKTGELSLRK